MSDESSQPVEAHHEPKYFVIWIWLAVLTVAEVAVVLIPGIPQLLVGAMLVLMALAKATLVAAFFMHLKFEARTLAWIAGTPLVLCVFLLLMLIPDALRAFF